MISISAVRKDFPIFANQPDLVYLDSAATSLKPQCVIDAVTAFYTTHTSNVHRGDYAIAAENDALYDGTRKTVASFINCDPREVIFTHNATASLNQAAYGLKSMLKEGDVILTTKAEHASNLLPWFQLQKEIGVKIEYAELDSQGRLTEESFLKALHDGVRIVAVAGVTNVTGAVQPVKAITKAAHAVGAYVVCDGAQSVPHMPVDVRDLDVDFLAFSAHKMCGPGGTGVLYGRRELLDRMDPVFRGGDMNARFSSEGTVILKEPPVRFEAGTPAIEGVIGMKAAIEYLQGIGMENIHAYEKELRAYFLEQMKKLDNIEILNPDNAYGPLTFNAKGVFSQDAAGYLASRNIAVRSGNHCAKILHEVIGTDSTIRASLYFYNTKEEIDRCVAACSEISLENAIGIFF